MILYLVTLVSGWPPFSSFISFGSENALSDYHHNTINYRYYLVLFIPFSFHTLFLNSKTQRFTCFYTQDTQYNTQYNTQHDTCTAAQQAVQYVYNIIQNMIHSTIFIQLNTQYNTRMALIYTAQYIVLYVYSLIYTIIHVLYSLYS